MKKTINRFQEDYMVAKALVKCIDAQQEEIERQYISENGIVNPGGSIPERIFCIEDPSVFAKANEACSALIVDAGLEDEMNSAKAILKEAENLLIQYGLSLAPAGVRETLSEKIKWDYTLRQKIIDLVLRLDVSTVSAPPLP